jgi:hypothetical protein
VAFGLDETDDQVIACAAAGFSGYVRREATADEFCSAVTDAVEARVHSAPSATVSKSWTSPPGSGNSAIWRVWTSATDRVLDVDYNPTDVTLVVGRAVPTSEPGRLPLSGVGIAILLRRTGRRSLQKKWVDETIGF